MAWCARSERYGSLTSYDVARGDLDQILPGGGASGSCLGSTSLPLTSDPTLPTPGKGFWYLARGRNVSHRGEILQNGQAVYEPHRRLSAADLSVLASIGGDPVPVFARPRVSVLTTGDELVGPREQPGRGQIREGNTFFLAAACAQLGCEVLRSAIVPDDPARLEHAFREALEDSDVLLTTGGVSVGKYDLLGAAFERIGVEPLLHKVAV